MSQAVLDLCTENKDKEQIYLDQALREAEVRPEVALPFLISLLLKSLVCSIRVGMDR